MDLEPLQLQHALEYASAQPVPLQRPQHLASFSYGEERELLIETATKDASLRWYRQPVLGLDLRNGYERCTWRPEDIDEGLDALLDSLQSRLNDSIAGTDTDELLRATAVVTWRGMATKLLTTVYEEREGFEMNAMMLDGCIYLEEHKSPHKRARTMDSSQRMQTYFGYSFESNCTTADPHAPLPATQEQCWSGDVNTNVQWCSIVKTALGDVPMVLGGEVDCVRDSAGIQDGLETQDFIELKTNLVIDSARDEVNFERYKLLKHYVQSLLLGVPNIIVGFRQDNGTLAGFQSFETLEIPRLVAEKPHVWHASSLLNGGHHIMTYLLGALASSIHVKAFDEQLAQGVLSPPESTPVFRISFTPASRDGKSIKLRMLSTEEVEQVQQGKTNKRQRVGFLPFSWIQSVQARKARRHASSTQLDY